jgi:hypothetical protein
LTNKDETQLLEDLVMGLSLEESRNDNQDLDENIKDGDINTGGANAVKNRKKKERKK